jgi:multidrug efflux pump subunit AcrA (membrane-fusion protein)
MYKYGILFITAVILFSASLASAQQREGGRREQSQGRPTSPVTVAEASEQYHVISVVGRLQPKSRIVHYTPNSGYILEVFIEEGQHVDEGQKLFSIRRKDDVTNIYKPTVVTARISGWVSTLHIMEEDEVDAGDPAVVIIGTEGYVLDAAISDKDAFKVRIGQRVTAHTTGGATITGILVNRSQEPDYDTGLFSLTFHFPNTQRTYVGEFVTIDLPADRTKGLFVRRDLIIRRYGKYFLWTINDEEKLAARQVLLGPTYGDLVRIDEGLASGERYLALLTGREKEGDSVEVPEK